MVDLVSMLTTSGGAEDTGGWDISTASYVQSVSSQDTGPQGLFFKPDGTKMYISGNSTDAILEFDLSTAWDISTVSYLQSFSTSAQETSPEQVWFKPDGTKMLVLGTAGDDVTEYTLSTAWNVSTASYVQETSVSQSAIANGFYIRSNGTTMYVADNGSNDVEEYTLSTAWSVNSISYVQSFSISNEEVSVTGIFFKDDGTRMYIVGTSGDTVFQYDLSTAWDISTASYSEGFDISSQEGAAQDIFFKPDGTKMYISGTTNNLVYEYDL
jgi:sugar lactone lactonase YvrE